MTTKQGNILIVDDEELVRQVIHRTLSVEGYHCREAANADQALGELRRNPIELVILDINMPGKSGIQLMPDIKEHYPDTVVIMMTGIVDTHTATQCIREGAFDYITKPINLDELLLSVDRALEVRRLRLIESDEQYKIIFESANDIILFLDRHGKILDVNSKLEEIGGYSKEDLLGKNIRSLAMVMTKKSLMLVVKNFMKRLAGITVPPYEVEMVAKTGEMLTFEINAVAIKRKGKTIGDLVMLRDMTERKQAEKALQESEERYRTVIEDAHDMIQSVRPDGSFIFANPAWLRTLGYTEKDLPNLNMFDVIHHESLPHCQEMFAKVMGGETVSNVSATFVARDGSKVMVEGNAAPRYVDDKIIATQGIFRDVTERKRAEEEIQQLYEKVKAFNVELEEKIKERTRELEVAVRNAEAANQAKSEFLSGMSHELRTPLTAVIGFAQVLGEQYFGELNEKQAEYVKDILESGEHLLSLINDILDLAKVEAGKLELELSEINMKELLESSLVMIKEKALKHSISIDARISPVLDDLLITADQRKLKQVMFNLLSNAAKFTPDQGQITIEAEREGEEFIISVADTGIGIARKDQEKVFEDFYQVRHGPADKTPGTGLGLPLTKHLVEMHGGRIWLESEGKGKGSRFIFSVPIRETKQGKETELRMPEFEISRS